MNTILKAYINQEIGINFQKPFHFESAELLAVKDEYFSIIDKEKGYIHHFSYSSIVQIIENTEGVEIGGLFTHNKSFSVLVKVGHLLEYVPA